MDNKEMEMTGLDPEEMEQISGGRALPESILKRFTRQEKEKGTPPEVVYRSFTSVGIDGYLGSEASYKKAVKKIVEKEYVVQLDCLLH